MWCTPNYEIRENISRASSSKQAEPGQSLLYWCVKKKWRRGGQTSAPYPTNASLLPTIHRPLKKPANPLLWTLDTVFW